MSELLPPQPSTPEEINTALETAREEHRNLLSEIAEARQFQMTREVQQKQLQDHMNYLSKEHKRITEWDKQVADRENAVKHYVLNADTGVISGNLQ